RKGKLWDDAVRLFVIGNAVRQHSTERLRVDGARDETDVVQFALIGIGLTEIEDELTGVEADLERVGVLPFALSFTMQLVSLLGHGGIKVQSGAHPWASPRLHDANASR